MSKDNINLLDTTLGGSFLHVSTEKARLILDQILSIELDYLLEVEPQSQLVETNSLPDTTSTPATKFLK